jgi:citrate lyase subunit beta/citryl-CoA lyase
MMGTSDLTNDLHALHTPDRSPLLYSLSKCVVAARAFRLRVIDGVFLDLNDAEVRWGILCCELMDGD